MVPLFWVYHKPPDAYATKNSVGSSGFTSMSATRPLKMVGPILAVSTAPSRDFEASSLRCEDVVRKLAAEGDCPCANECRKLTSRKRDINLCIVLVFAMNLLQITKLKNNLAVCQISVFFVLKYLI